jgi:WXG100 protein secretion system (Wss), protein YukD
LKCTLLDMTENWELELELDETLPLGELLPEMLAELGLPKRDLVGHPVEYGLCVDDAEHLADPELSLVEAGARDGSRLLLIAALPL